jgi:cytosine/adenosine deaminase-related metal-dependent hydrolase
VDQAAGKDGEEEEERLASKAKAASRGGHYVAGGFVDEQGVFREHLVIGHCMHLSYDIHDSTCI